MKKTVVGIISAIFVLSLSITAFAVENISEKEGSRQIDVQAKAVYTNPENMYTEPVTDGKASITTKNDATISATAGENVLNGLTLNVTEMVKGDKEAYNWVHSTMSGTSSQYEAYDIYFTDKNGNRVDVTDDMTVSIKTPDGYKSPMVYYIASDGTKTPISSTQSGKKTVFTVNDLGYYVLSNSNNSSNTNSNPTNSSKSDNSNKSEGTPNRSEAANPEASSTSNSPATGDTSNIAFFVAIMFVSFGMISVLGIVNKRRKERE